MTGEGEGSALRRARGLYNGFVADGGPRLGSALAFTSLFALAPMTIVAVAVARRLLGSEVVAQRLAATLEGILGPRLAGALVQVLAASLARYDGTAGVVGIVLVAWTLVAAYLALYDSFNRMWHVRVASGVPLSLRLRYEVPRIGLALLPASALVALTLASAAFVWVADRLRLPVVGDVLAALGSPVSLALAAWASLSILYLLVPAARVTARDAVVPAALVGAVWGFGSWLYGAYLTYVGGRSVSGAAGAVLLLLVWIDYTARAVLFGAWWGRARVERHGAVEPRPYAERYPYGDACDPTARGASPSGSRTRPR